MKSADGWRLPAVGYWLLALPRISSVNELSHRRCRCRR